MADRLLKKDLSLNKLDILRILQDYKYILSIINNNSFYN